MEKAASIHYMSSFIPSMVCPHIVSSMVCPHMVTGADALHANKHDKPNHHMLIPMPTAHPPIPRAPTLESQLGSKEPQGYPGQKNLPVTAANAKN